VSLVLWKRPVALPVSTCNSGVGKGEEVFTVGQGGLLLTVNLGSRGGTHTTNNAMAEARDDSGDSMDETHATGLRSEEIHSIGLVLIAMV